MNINSPVNLRSCAICSRILRTVHKRGYLRTAYCENCYCLKRGAGTEHWRKMHNNNFMTFSRI